VPHFALIALAAFVATAVAMLLVTQTKERVSGMKSEVWVIVVIFTGSIGLLRMLARTLYRERKLAAGNQ